MRQHKWFFLLLIATLLLPGCQTNEMTAANPEAQISLVAKVNPLTISGLPQQAHSSSEAEVNECLQCHENKQRLIETAREEQVVEAESSGVG